MNKIYHKFLIAFVVFIALAGFYLYFSNSLESEASLLSSLSSSQEGKLLSDDKISMDIAFISTLTSLNNIKIDATLFTNQSFTLLRDNTVRLEPVTPGRINPFAPIIGENTYTSVVSTNKTVEIKGTDIVLGGVINNINKKGVGYFEYGLTKELGQKTSQVTVSLIGSFVANITGLDMNKTYFYKACAKISGASFCGDIVSFETN